jgi:hypothetical protein
MCGQALPMTNSEPQSPQKDGNATQQVLIVMHHDVIAMAHEQALNNQNRICGHLLKVLSPT